MHDVKVMLGGSAAIALLLFVLLVRVTPRAGLVAAELLSAALAAVFALPVPALDGWGRSAGSLEILPSLTACAACVAVASLAKKATRAQGSPLAVGVVVLAIAIGLSSLAYGALTFVIFALRYWKLFLIPVLFGGQLAAVVQAGRQA